MIILNRETVGDLTVLGVCPTRAKGARIDQNGSGFLVTTTDYSGEIRIPLDPLIAPADVWHSLYMDISQVIPLDHPLIGGQGSGRETVTVQFQDSSAALQYGETYLNDDIQINPGEPAEIIILGAYQVQFQGLEIGLQRSAAAYRYPSEAIEVEVLAPVPDSDALQWDLRRWDRAAWDKEKPSNGALIWQKDSTDTSDQYRWNSARWQGGVSSYQWQSIIGPATTVTITRGVTGLANGSDVGTMEVEALGDLDPRAIGISVGTPVRAFVWDSLEYLFTGTLSSATVSPNPPNAEYPYTVTLEFVDATSTLASITRYGARASTPDGAEPWYKRVERVMQSAAETAYTIDEATSVPACPTVWETSVANYLDALTAMAAGYWSVDRENHVHISAGLPQTDPVIISDTFTKKGLYYTDIIMQWDSTELISTVEATTYEAHIEDGEWRANDKTITVSHRTDLAAWTGKRASVDMLTPTTDTWQEDAAERLLRLARKTPPIRSVTLKVKKHDWQTSRVMARLDPIQQATVWHQREQYDTRIKQVQHRITPKTWETRITFND